MFSWVCHWKCSNQGSWEKPGGFATGIEHCHRYWNPSRASVRFLPVFVTDGTTYGLSIAFTAEVHQTGLLIRGTVAGIYDLRRLQIKRCGRLGQRAVLALDCCLSITTRNVQPQVWVLKCSIYTMGLETDEVAEANVDSGKPFLDNVCLWDGAEKSNITP